MAGLCMAGLCMAGLSSVSEYVRVIGSQHLPSTLLCGVRRIRGTIIDAKSNYLPYPPATWLVTTTFAVLRIYSPGRVAARS